ncbi:MAG TPA: VWA domain-containing protein [Candidatus Polarisedimenticolaceae bacterium]|nr:VWA domain-containing protein [Candidatus Polarisedimenticolaceae bacterium]
MLRCMGSVLVLLALVVVATQGSEEAGPSAEKQPSEAIEVRVVLIEALVVDAEGNAVPDLTADEFQLAIGGVLTPIESLDVYCPAAAAGAAGRDGAAAGAPAASDRVPLASPPRIVFAVDYRHLEHHDRTKVLDRIGEMVGEGFETGEQEIMIAAIADRMRVEQRFSRDLDEVLATLHRMDYDRTLFAVDSEASTGEEWFDQLSTLMDVLEVYDGPKAVVLVSTVQSRDDVLEAWFDEVYERAAAARVTIYPAYARWMTFSDIRRGMYRAPGTAGGRRILPALADGTGGSLPSTTDDLSLAYVRARRDLGCRYTVGFEVDSDVAGNSMELGLQVRRPGVRVLCPASSRVRSDEERRQSRLRAAFADPQSLDSPLVRAQAIPLRPVDGKTWQTLLAVQFPLPPRVGDNGFEVRASLAGSRAKTPPMIERHFPLSGAGEAGRPVTVLGDSPLESGSHMLTVAVSEPGSDDVVTTQTRVDVPAAPKDGVILQGPMLARVLDDNGEFLRRLEQAHAGTPPLEELLEDERLVELLLINEVRASDTLVAFWHACAAGKQSHSRPLAVERRIVTAEGEPVRTLDRHTFRGAGDGRTRCDGTIDPIPAGTLAPGEYVIEVVVVDDDSGAELARESAPVSLR